MGYLFTHLDPVLQDRRILLTDSVPQSYKAFGGVFRSVVTELPFCFDPFDVVLIDLVFGVLLLNLIYRIFTQRFQKTALEDFEVKFIVVRECCGGVGCRRRAFFFQ